MKLFLILPFLLFSLATFNTATAQLKYRDYTWDENPTCSAVPDSVKDLNEVSVRDLYALEYVFTNDGNFLQVSTSHVVLKLNTSQGIEANNRIYLDVDADAGEAIKTRRGVEVVVGLKLGDLLGPAYFVEQGVHILRREHTIEDADIRVHPDRNRGALLQVNIGRALLNGKTDDFPRDAHGCFCVRSKLGDLVRSAMAGQP
jgi:hypothetical protein